MKNRMRIKNNIVIYFSMLLLFTSFLSCKKETIIVKEEFKNNNQKWDTINVSSTINTMLAEYTLAPHDNPNHEHKVDFNAIVLTNKTKDTLNFSLIKIIIPKKEFEITTLLSQNKFYGDNGLIGFVLFADNKQPEDYFFFGTNEKKEVILSHTNKGNTKIYYQNLNKYLYLKGANEFMVKAMGNYLYFTLNKKYITRVARPKNLYDYYGYMNLYSEMGAYKIEVK